MFYNKVHGSCTSTAVYLATIFRTLGIPARIVFCIPPFDPNDDTQARMFYDNIHHNQVRETVRTALDGASGFNNHLFNEVYVGHRWVRLNYGKLGQPVLDGHYFGLLSHIYTCSDLSRVPLAQTWGMRYFKYSADRPKLSSANPYRLISVHDHFGTNAHLDNPPVPPAELRAITIIGLYQPDSIEVPKWARDDLTQHNGEIDFLIACKEWVAGGYNEMRAFQKRAGHEFLLTAPQQPEVRVHLAGLNLSTGDGSFQAYGAQVVPEDKTKLVPGVAYNIQPINISDTYRWVVAPDTARLTFQNTPLASVKTEEDWGQTLTQQPPVVVETCPVSGACDVAPGETEIRVRFSKDMADGSWSWSTAWQDSTPESVGTSHYLDDHRTCVMKVRLEPGRTYAWWLNSGKFKNFTDQSGRPAIPYLLIFQTKPN
jgi:hypothetical protein